MPPQAYLAQQVSATTAWTMTQVEASVTAAYQNVRFAAPAMTLTVCRSGCDYTDPLAAFYVAIGYETTAIRNITISIADGTYTETNQIYTENPLGKFIRVVGDTTNNANVVLNFTNIGGTNYAGFAANAGGMIGSIDGVTINGIGAQSTETSSGTSWNSQSYGAGILAAAGSYVGLGPHVTINHFYYGVAADNNGLVDAHQGGVTVTDAGDVGFMARGNGTIVCNNCHAVRAADTTPGQTVLGCGFDAERGGSLYIDGSTTQDTYVAGVCALTGGHMWAHGVVGSGGLGGQQGFGVALNENAAADLTDSKFTGYGTGVYAAGGASGNIDGVTVTGSAGDGIVADDGQLEGTGTSSQDNGAFGFHAFHQGTLLFYGSLGNTIGNRLGQTAIEPAGVLNGVAYQASFGAIQ